MNPIFILASHSILDASKGFDPGQFIQSILAIVCLAIDSVVYYITSVAFKLYLAISQFELFNTSAFDDMINGIQGADTRYKNLQKTFDY